MAFRAVFDESGFKRGFEPGDAALVDVGFLVVLRRLFDVDVVQGLAFDDRHAQFFRLRGIDEHSLHCAFLARCCTRKRRWRFVPGYRKRLGCTGVRRVAPSVPALRHHGGPRERLFLSSCCRAGDSRRVPEETGASRGALFGSVTDAHASGDGGVCRAAVNMAAPRAVATTLRRGSRGRPAFGRCGLLGPWCSSCEIKPLSRPPSVTDQALQEQVPAWAGPSQEQAA